MKEASEGVDGAAKVIGEETSVTTGKLNLET
jgi:hypothetical protein